MATYTDKEKNELINTICERISEGNSLRSVLDPKDMPSMPTFYKWIDDNDERIKQYARACETRADVIFDEMFDIADDGTNDFVKKDIGDGVQVDQLNSEHIQRSRLRIDTRKWALSKMNPKKYGDRLNIESPEGSMSPKTGLENKSFEELYQLKYGKKPE